MEIKLLPTSWKEVCPSCTRSYSLPLFQHLVERFSIFNGIKWFNNGITNTFEMDLPKNLAKMKNLEYVTMARAVKRSAQERRLLFWGNDKKPSLPVEFGGFFWRIVCVSTARNLTDLKLDWNVICLCLIHLLHIDGIIDKFPSFHALGVSRVEEVSTSSMATKPWKL